MSQNQEKATRAERENLLPGIRSWLEAYRDSVGPSGDLCLELFDGLVERKTLTRRLAPQVLELIKVLECLSPDPTTVCSAMVLAINEQGVSVPADEPFLAEPIRRQLGDLKKLKHYESGQSSSGTERSAEGLRRLLLALVQDVRVVLIDLSWQLVLLRAAKGETDRARELARETMLIHAPLANRLGVWQLKWELEDLSFRFQEPDQYRKIAQLVAEHRTERERFIEGFIERLSSELDKAGIQAEVKGRPKHIYSIWKKMQRKGLDFHQLFDVRAVRVLVEDLPSCYSALGLVHTLWQPIPGEFDDYITTPKGNNYQSLHTAVANREGKAVEVQIRTREMHEHAELGVAAHWRYKEGGPTDPGFDNKIAIMRQLLDSEEDSLDDESLLDSFRSATTEDRVYVLTPQGQVVDMALGSTVLDFAYHVHTEVGHRCRGAKVNGRIVPLTHVVITGDRVEILTAKQPHPSRDWLNPRLGYINGARARAKVRQWFKRESRDDNLRAGKDSLESEAKRLGLQLVLEQELLDRFHMASEEDLHVAIGNGDLTASQVLNAFERMVDKRTPKQVEDLVTRTPNRQKIGDNAAAGDLTIEGVGNLMTSMARCCHPVPGDRVVGYITQGRGVTIHRDDCRQVVHWQSENSPRLLKVNWGHKAGTLYPVQLLVRAYNRRDLIQDISTILSTSELQVTDIRSSLDETLDEVTIRLNVRVKGFEQLSDVINRLGNVPNVIESRRLAPGQS